MARHLLHHTALPSRAPAQLAAPHCVPRDGGVPAERALPAAHGLQLAGRPRRQPPSRSGCSRAATLERRGGGATERRPLLLLLRRARRAEPAGAAVDADVEQAGVGARRRGGTGLMLVCRVLLPDRAQLPAAPQEVELQHMGQP